MSFFYEPQASDQRAEIISRAGPVIAENFRRGEESLGNRIGSLLQEHKQLKAKQSLAEGYMTMMGTDAKTAKERVGKMKMGQVDAFLTLAPLKQQSGILGRALQGMVNRQSPEQPSGALGTPPAAGEDMGTQFTRMLARASAAGASPETMSALSNLGKTVSTMYSRGMTVDPSTGLRLFNGRPLPAATQKILGFGGGATGQPPGINFTPGPGGTEFWNYGNRAGEVRPPPPTTRPENFGLGPFPKGTTFGVSNGVKTATTPDGQMYVLPSGGGAGGPQIDNQGNLVTPGSGAGSPGSSPSPQPSPPGRGGKIVTVKDKDGKRFTLPAEQLEEAKKQGYTEVPDAETQ